MEAPNQAVDELRHAVRVLGLRGAQIGSNVAGKNLDDPELEPVWAPAAELDAFILLHPLNVAGAERLSSSFFGKLIRHPPPTPHPPPRFPVRRWRPPRPPLAIILPPC